MKKNINQIIAKNIKEIRKHQHISRKKLAKRIDKNKSYIEQIESGVFNLSVDEIELIARAFHIPYERLFMEEASTLDKKCKVVRKKRKKSKKHLQKGKLIII